MKHFFLQPSLLDPYYVCGGWQIFNRNFEVVRSVRPAELITYRHREPGYRYLDDVPVDEFNAGQVWIHWQSHFPELAGRLSSVRPVAAFAQTDDIGRVPPGWAVVTLSRYIAAQWSIRQPARHISYLGTTLAPAAVNLHAERDIDILVHKRKLVPYVMEKLVPALQSSRVVRVIHDFVSQAEYFSLLNRTKILLYWFHQPKFWDGYEGFGMQPLEAISCGAIPLTNFYGGLSDYLMAPFNCRKIGTHSLEYDLLQIDEILREYQGRNPDEERIRAFYAAEAFLERFAAVETSLAHYFTCCPPTPPEKFSLVASENGNGFHPYEWAYRVIRRRYKKWKKILPR